MNTTFTRKLGRSGLQVSAMGLGCWAIGGAYWKGKAAVGWGNVNDEESIRAIHRALDLGITFFDTADKYGTGHSERLLAQALKGHRHRVVIATKFGITFDETSRQLTGRDASPEYIRQACEASLRRLNCEYIDLYQFHLGQYDHSQAGVVRDVLEDLVAEGKIRYYGWSNDSPEANRIFAKGPNCSAVQHQLNVLYDAAPMLTLCEELNLASINRTPLAMGLLTGKYRVDSVLPFDDVRGNKGNKGPSWMRFFKDGKPNPEWFNKLNSIREILTSSGRTLAQGALAWIWARSEKTIPIPGFKSVAQVEENSAAMQFGPLSAEQLREIDILIGR